MKKFKYLTLFLLPLFACNNTGSSSSANQLSDFYKIKKQLSEVENGGINAVSEVESGIRQSAYRLTEAEKDSVYVLFYEAFYSAVGEFSDEMHSGEYATLAQKLAMGENDNETEAFKKKVDSLGFLLLSSEGMYYVDAKPDYFYNLFKENVSPVLEEFLQMKSKEAEQGFAEDAFLKITYNELYRRTVVWDDFISKYPDFFLKDEAEALYASYLLTLMTGMDNSPVFDYRSRQLLPEIKKLYENVVAGKNPRQTTAIIANYYELLKANGFRQPDDIDKFLENNGLYPKHW